MKDHGVVPLAGGVGGDAPEEAWRTRPWTRSRADYAAEIEAKRARNARFRAMEEAAREATYRPEARRRIDARRRHDLEEKALEIVAAYESGEMGTKLLAKKYECSQETIRRMLVKRGVEIRSDQRPPARTDVSEFAVDIIVRYELHGAGIKKLAKEYGCSQGTIRRLLVKHDVEIRTSDRTTVTPSSKVEGKAGKRLNHWGAGNELPFDEVRAAYEAGTSLRELAGRYGVCSTTIGNLLRRNGVATTGKGRWGPRPLHFDLNEAIAAHQAGESINSLSKRLRTDKRRLKTLMEGALSA